MPCFVSPFCVFEAVLCTKYLLLQDTHKSGKNELNLLERTMQEGQFIRVVVVAPPPRVVMDSLQSLSGNTNCVPPPPNSSNCFRRRNVSSFFGSYLIVLNTATGYDFLVEKNTRPSNSACRCRVLEVVVVGFSTPLTP